MASSSIARAEEKEQKRRKATNSTTKTTLKLSSSAGPSIAVNGKTSVYNLTGVDAYTRYMHRVALPPLVSGML